MVNSLEKRCLSSDLYYQALVVDLTKINFWEKPGDSLTILEFNMISLMECGIR